MSAPLIPVLVENLLTDEMVECWFYAVPREGEHVEVYATWKHARVGDRPPVGPGAVLFTGNVRAVLWSSRDPRPTVRIK